MKVSAFFSENKISFVQIAQYAAKHIKYTQFTELQKSIINFFHAFLPRYSQTLTTH